MLLCAAWRTIAVVVVTVVVATLFLIGLFFLKRHAPWAIPIPVGLLLLAWIVPIGIEMWDHCSQKEGRNDE